MKTTREKDVLRYFPHKTPREGQIETITDVLSAFDSGKKFVLLEGPTGCGKSAIGMTIARMMRAYYLTVQKSLQDQLARDFQAFSVTLKGRNAYQCTKALQAVKQYEKSKTFRDTYNKMHRDPPVPRRCDEGLCRLEGSNRYIDCIDAVHPNLPCPYWRQRELAKIAPICVMNTHSFLFQTLYGGFKERKLIIVDECHRLEGILMDFVTFTVSDKELPGMKFSKCETPSEYAELFEKIALEEKILVLLSIAQNNKDIKEIDKWDAILAKYKRFMENTDDSRWVSLFKDYGGFRSIQLKPIFVDTFAESLVFDLADHVLLMSATIMDAGVMCESLGMDRDEVYSKRLKSRFPVKNRPVLHTPSGSLSFKKKRFTYPKLIEDVDQICAKHGDERGIIHTHNFEIANILMDNCPSNHRFYFQKSFDSKTEMLEEHKKSPNGVIVAPAMHEGTDLIDDLARFQIICKVPYPSFHDNEQLKIRMELSRDYYNWLTATSIVQAYGRSVRSEDDWAITYIMDEDFRRFFNMTERMLPGWFKEAVRWDVKI